MKQNKLRFSRWTKSFSESGVIAFFHSILLNVVFIPNVEAEKIFQFFNSYSGISRIASGIDEEIIRLLKVQKLLVEDSVDDLDILREVREELRKNITLESMYLLLTDGCNLRCKYCFEDTPSLSGNFKAMMMSEDIAKNSVNLFAQLVKKYGSKEKKKVIHLYGGEPLLNIEVVSSIIPYISDAKVGGKLPENCETVVVTNGTRISEELADLFSDHRITVGISLDGPKEINNKNRVSPDVEDVFTRVVSSYELLKRKEVTVGLSVTLTPEVVDNFDYALDFFIERLGIQDGLSFNILHYNPTLSVDGEYFKKAAVCIIKAFERFRVMGVYEERMMRKAKAFINKAPMFADCSVVGSQIVVAPDGRIGVCQDFVKPRTYFSGSVTEEGYDPFMSGLFTGWETRSPFFMEQCYDCEALGICGGGCPASVELKTGSRWNIDERICYHSKLTLEWLVWETFKKM